MDQTRAALQLQFSMAWQLLEYHLAGLTDDECLWRPAQRGLHVRAENGGWQADWPESEAYDIGPASIAWITWHVVFWWSMVLNHSFGDQTLTRELVLWPGNADAVKERIAQLKDDWSAAFASLSDEELASNGRTRWPFEGQPFYEVGAWLNLELMKNAAEIGYCRFLYATRG